MDVTISQSITDVTITESGVSVNLVATPVLSTILGVPGDSGIAAATAPVAYNSGTQTVSFNYTVADFEIVGDALKLKDTARLNVDNVFTKSQVGTFDTLLSVSNNIAWNASTAQGWTHTMTENTTLNNPTNMRVNQSGTFSIRNHASSPKTLSWGNIYKAAGGISNIALTATNGALDVFSYWYDGTNVIISMLPDCT